jgi:hypothetical protein
MTRIEGVKGYQSGDQIIELTWSRAEDPVSIDCRLEDLRGMDSYFFHRDAKVWVVRPLSANLSLLSLDCPANFIRGLSVVIRGTTDQCRGRDDHH